MTSQELMTIDFAQDSGAGMEEVDSESFAIPFISVLQGLSPQIETVDGAKPGLFINTVTEELAKEVEVIPCSYRRRYLQWAPREQGGGFRGEHKPGQVESGLIGEKIDGRYYVEDDLLKDTRSHYVLVKNGSGVWVPAVVSLSSTQIKKSKKWMSMIQGLRMEQGGKSFTPPMFSHSYKLTSVKEQNNEGSWYGVQVQMVGPITDPEVYNAAKSFSNEVSEGKVETQQEPTTEEGF